VELRCRKSWAFVGENKLLDFLQRSKFLLTLVYETLEIVRFSPEPIDDFVLFIIAGRRVEIRKERTDTADVHFSALVAFVGAHDPGMALKTTRQAQLELLLRIVLPRLDLAVSFLLLLHGGLLHLVVVAADVVVGGGDGSRMAVKKDVVVRVVILLR